MIDFNLMSQKHEDDLINSNYNDNSHIQRILDALEKIKDSY